MSEKIAEKMIKCPICGAEEDEGWNNRLELHINYEHESMDKAKIIVKLLKDRESAPKTAEQDPFENDVIQLLQDQLPNRHEPQMTLERFLKKWAPIAEKAERWDELSPIKTLVATMSSEEVLKALEAQRRLEAARQVVDDYCPEIGMTLTFRLKFYEVTGFPMPEWLKDICEVAEGRAEP